MGWRRYKPDDMPSPRSPLSRPDWLPERLAARLPALRRRALLLADTRAFFTARGYTEVETPALVREAARAFPGQVAVGIDARLGFVAS